MPKLSLIPLLQGSHKTDTLMIQPFCGIWTTCSTGSSPSTASFSCELQSFSPSRSKFRSACLRYDAGADIRNACIFSICYSRTRTSEQQWHMVPSRYFHMPIGCPHSFLGFKITNMMWKQTLRHSENGSTKSNFTMHFGLAH